MKRILYWVIGCFAHNCLSKATDYNSLMGHYDALMRLNTALHRIFELYGCPYPHFFRVKTVINNQWVIAGLNLGRSLDDHRLTEKNPQMKLKDIWSPEVASKVY